MKKKTQVEKLISKLKRKSMTTIEIIDLGILNPYGAIKKARKNHIVETVRNAKGKMARFYYRGEL